MASWADQPFALIPVKSQKSSSPDAEFIAQDMAAAHNNLLRALNSVYNQAPYVENEADKRDLLLYTSFWVDWIEHHHHGEEELFFPAIGQITGHTSLMAHNIEQHEAFLPGLHALKAYVTACLDASKPESFASNKYREIVDSFAPILTEHLGDEIGTLLKLEACTEDMAKLKAAYLVFDAKMREGDKAILYPLVMGSSDAEFEGGPLWPVVPAPVRYLIHYVFERKHRSVWRFSPSDTWGKRQEPAFGPSPGEG